MSMISALIDELNKSADEWNSSNMFELARMCREAADTITELRGALQVASVDYRHLSEENAKLRELVERLHADQAHWELDNCPGCPNVADLQEALAENANLRERITTQKQIIQAYRDESREWREVAECAQAENAKLRGQYEAAIDDYRSEVAKLRELCGYLLPFAKSCGAEHPLMRELGVEVDDAS